MARPPTGETPIQHVRAPDDDWADLDTASGGQRPEVVRDLIRWYLRRPGARLPDRPAASNWPAIRNADATAWFAGFGHSVDPSAVDTDAKGGLVWHCQACDGRLSVTVKGKFESSTGKTPCPGNSTGASE